MSRNPEPFGTAGANGPIDIALRLASAWEAVALLDERRAMDTRLPYAHRDYHRAEARKARQRAAEALYQAETIAAAIDGEW